MNGKRKTTRKSFFKWSGLAFVGGLLFAGKRFSGSETSELVDGVNHSKSPVASRIRPAQNIVVRESV